jgi:hypothetical protein
MWLCRRSSRPIVTGNGTRPLAEAPRRSPAPADPVL